MLIVSLLFFWICVGVSEPRLLLAFPTLIIIIKTLLCSGGFDLWGPPTPVPCREAFLFAYVGTYVCRSIVCTVYAPLNQGHPIVPCREAFLYTEVNLHECNSLWIKDTQLFLVERLSSLQCVPLNHGQPFLVGRPSSIQRFSVDSESRTPCRERLWCPYAWLW